MNSNCTGYAIVFASLTFVFVTCDIVSMEMETTSDASSPAAEIQMEVKNGEAMGYLGAASFILSNAVTGVDDVKRGKAACQRYKVKVEPARENTALYADVELAIREYSEAIHLEPDNAKAYLNRGLARYDKGDYRLAIQDFDKTIHLVSGNMITYLTRAVNTDEHEQKEQDISEVIRLTPDMAKPHYYRGLARHKTGDYEQAIRDYSDVLRFIQDDADVYYARGNAWCKKGEYEQALFDFEKALELAPDDS